MMRVVAISAAVLWLSIGAASPARAWGAKGGASTSMLVRATPKVVWKAIHDERNVDPDVAYAKVLNRSDKRELLEQKFVRVPVLGDVVAVTQADEIPYESIEYKLVKSDKFKDLKGRWQLQAADGGKSTMLTLTSYLDTGLPVGAAFVRANTKERVNRRLSNVKRIAEQAQRQLAASGKEDL